jgi:hypothetical protein
MELGGGLGGFAPSESPRKRILWGTVAALLLAGGFTFAANLTINTNNKVEFGQGIYQIKSCDQFVNIGLKASATINGYSRVANITVKGLDVGRCAGTTVRLKLFNTDSATDSQTAMALYATPGYTETGTAVIMVIRSGASQATAFDDVTLVNQRGTNIGYGDVNQSIDYYDASGDFVISFTRPLARMDQVNLVTLESANNA